MYWRYVPRQRTSVVRWWREFQCATPADFKPLIHTGLIHPKSRTRSLQCSGVNSELAKPLTSAQAVNPINGRAERQSR